MTAVKICGLRTPEDAVSAALAGADMLGFIFAPAKRRVTPEIAREAISAVKRLQLARLPKFAGVFVNEAPERIESAGSFAGLDLVQLSGNESPEFAARMSLPVIKALHLGDAGQLEAVKRAAGDFLKRVPGISLLVDTLVPGHYGGTGQVGDWHMAADLAGMFPVILAGGLNPVNVAEAIRKVRPLAVDVSSGVETDGRKDAGKIAAFVRAAKAEGSGDEAADQ
ncbi:MAG: phosphoribosylanthranilate isomerase [Chloroflexi bacterium]|nr:phosphoribosylanthranilate isomerase [Chloroflexota bacterium]